MKKTKKKENVLWMNEFDHRILLFIHANPHFKYKKSFCINIIQDVLCWHFIKFLDEVKMKKNVKAPVFQITVDFYNIEDKYFLEAEFFWKTARFRNLRNWQFAGYFPSTCTWFDSLRYCSINTVLTCVNVKFINFLNHWHQSDI